ncbi:MAG: type II secretion system protein [bacterium]|nr:type II secretion system protein [bacterium]
MKTILPKKLRSVTMTSMRSGFTLVEVLVVMAIVALLSAILYPSFSSAREKTRQSACISNIKSIGQAVRMYSLDNDRKIPDRVEGTTGAYKSWAGVLKDGGYVGGFSIFRCPSDSRNILSSNLTLIGNASDPDDYLEQISYNYAKSADRLDKKRSALLDKYRPDDTIALSGYGDTLADTDGNYPPLPFCGKYGPDDSKSAGGDHKGVYFVLYRDGRGARYRNNAADTPTSVSSW